ncbi:hypothetical protein MLD38_020399 [Melastoma candidum]|uniref:Uncharacterized protein n=1 Tax=Melastoma candidum TaxID=119954 RepID=A0ACB9QCD6_9MYRT|nr:hypothetical protein MLD38_020399 [Melastoma candidum]
MAIGTYVCDLATLVFALLLFSPSVLLSVDVRVFVKYPLPPGTTGPEAISFTEYGVGPFTGISDGSIIKLNPLLGTFEYFAYAAPNKNKTLCDGNSDPSLYSKCGRPLGSAFNGSDYLYFCDVYFGLNGVGPAGGQATQLVTSAGGQPVYYCNAVAVDPINGTVYFLDTSQRFKNILQMVLANDRSGRLLSYEPATGNVKVLENGLAGPAGLAISNDGSYLLISVIITQTIQKFYLTGPKANTLETLPTSILRPGNIERIGSRDEFLVPENIGPVVHYAIKIDGNGIVLGNESIAGPYTNVSYLRDLQPLGDSIFIGSEFDTFVGATASLLGLLSL